MYTCESADWLVNLLVSVGEYEINTASGWESVGAGVGVGIAILENTGQGKTKQWRRRRRHFQVGRIRSNLGHRRQTKDAARSIAIAAAVAVAGRGDEIEHR